jgi:O-antigen/teichoic acid export membrane protein
MMGLRRRLLPQSGLLFAARLFGAGVIFLAQAAIARFWGAEQLGEYLVIIASVNIVAVVLPLGFQTIGTYFAAEYRARGEAALLRRFMRRAYGFVAVTALALLLLGAPLVGLVGEPGRVLAQHWVPTVLMAAATAVVYTNSAILIGLKHPLAGILADTLFRPLVIVLAITGATLALPVAQMFDALVWLLAIGFSAVAAGQFLVVVRTVRAVPEGTVASRSEPSRWWRFALPWVVMALATDFFFDIDLLILSNLLDRETLAVFGVATRVFSIIAFGVSAVYAVVLPEMFERNAASDRPGFVRQIGEANLIACGISLALFAAVVMGAPILLMLFGPAFAAGEAPLAVLCLALCVRSALGPAALVLSIHDRPYAPLPAVALGMAVLVGGNLLLVPLLGLMGAALAALAAQTVWSVAMWLTARRIAGVDVSVLPRLREIVSSKRAERPL